jgi:2-octaprenylphenol hydroxylase
VIRPDFDVAIVGAGMVGAALACALGDLGFRVAVIETREPSADWPPATIDARTSALTRASEHILRNLGVWERMSILRVSPYRRMHVWDAAGFGEIHFDCAEIGEPNLGHIVENRVIQRALWERLGALPTVTRICPASVSALELGSEHPVLTLDTAAMVATGRSLLPPSAAASVEPPSALQLQPAGRSGVHAAIEHVGRPSGRHQHRDLEVAPTGAITLNASLIVAADGAQSAVRAMAGLGTRGWAYDQHAVVAIVRPARHHDDTAWQRFLPAGPVALLPIRDGRCNVVWSTEPEQAAAFKAMPDDEFCSALAGATQARLGDIRETSTREVFPLRLQHAENYVEPGLALVGDAAHAIHPLAGQGVNLGLLDAATLADVLAQAAGRGRPLGAMATLRRYERARKGANLAMLGAMDAFKRLFSNDNPALYLARNVGLRVTDLAPPVKHAIMRRALGISGERPSLALPRYR